MMQLTHREKVTAGNVLEPPQKRNLSERVCAKIKGGLVEGAI